MTCLDLFSEETPCGLILVRNHLLYLAPTHSLHNSLHFEWSLTGDSTVYSYL